MNRQWVFWTVTGNLFDYLEPSIKHNKRFYEDYGIRVIPLAVCTTHSYECKGNW